MFMDQTYNPGFTDGPLVAIFMALGVVVLVWAALSAKKTKGTPCPIKAEAPNKTPPRSPATSRPAAVPVSMPSRSDSDPVPRSLSCCLMVNPSGQLP